MSLSISFSLSKGREEEWGNTRQIYVTMLKGRGEGTKKERIEKGKAIRKYL